MPAQVENLTASKDAPKVKKFLNTTTNQEVEITVENYEKLKREGYPLEHLVEK